VLKKTIVYTDFNGDEVKEDFFFHLSKAELIELEASHQDGFSTAMQNIIDTNDGRAIMFEMKKIVLMSYGKKSADGRRFIKNQTLREEFESSEAYSTLFVELVTDPDAAVIFMNGIIPSGLEELADKITAIGQPSEPEEVDYITMTRAEAENLPFERQESLMAKILSGEIRIVD
jgi:hypothetical protein